jgi:UDP-N-acetylglucosamine acyltransferase
MAVGQPASAHSVNAEGLKRRGFTTEQIRNIRNAFRVLYRSGLKLVDATRELEALAKEQPEIQAIVEFLRLSTRSIPVERARRRAGAAWIRAGGEASGDNCAAP